jgi:serine/threonine protein kinase/tetratricopeptide (TPR) repeat protein
MSWVITCEHCHQPQTIADPNLPLARHLEELWRRGQRPDVHGLLAAAGSLSPAEVVAVLRIDQWHRWQVGAGVPAEEYLHRYPGLAARPEQVLELIYSEFLLREAAGERPSLHDFRQRFPKDADRLEHELEHHRTLQGSERTTSGQGTVCLPPETMVSAPPAAGLRPQVTGYEILGELGRGGMGVVYKARHVRLNRIVALKMVLVGDFAQPETLARFLAEAEIAARVQHPNVVQIYEAGEHNRLPYLALEYVEGGSLAGRLGGQSWPARQAAELVETLAGAIHFAHQRGVIHRDLKPANILLQSGVRSTQARSASEGIQARSASEGAGLPLASASGLCATDHGLPKITDFGLAKLLDVDAGPTETGMILGTPSYMAPEQAGGQSRSIGPAADVYGLGAILYELLTGRPPFKGDTPLDTMDLVRTTEPVAPQRLQPHLPRDLCVICLKCLAKQPSRRYAGADVLAADLRRYLDGRPIQARPVPAWERAWMWVRRRPLAAAFAAVAVLAVFGLLGVWATFTVRLGEQRNQAVASADEANRQRQRAEANQERTLEAVDRFLTRVGDKKLAPIPAMEEVRRDLLTDALQFFQTILRDTDDPDPGVRREVARAQQRAARIYRLLGQRDREGTHWQAALAMQRRLAEELPGEPAHRFDVSQTLHNLGLWQQSANHLAEAESAFQEAIALRQALIQEFPDQPEYQAGLGRTYNALGLFYRRARGRHAEAETAYHSGVAVQQALVDQHSGVAEYQSDLAATHQNLGALEFTRGRLDKAEAAWERGRELFVALVQNHPEDSGYVGGLAATNNNLSVVFLETGRVEQAQVAIRAALDSKEKLARDHRSVPVYRLDVASGYNNLSRIYERLGQGERQLEALATARTTLQELLREYPGRSDCRLTLAEVGVNLATARRERGQRTEARTICQEAITLLEPEVRANAGQLDHAVQLGAGYVTLGDILLDRKGMVGEAIARNDQALRTLSEVLVKAKEHREAREWYGKAQRQRGLAFLVAGKYDEAQAAWDQALSGGFADRDAIQRDRALGFALQGNSGQAVALIEHGKPSSPADIYETACIYALAAEAVAADGKPADAERDRRVRRLEDRVVELLAGCYPGSAAYAFADLHKYEGLGIVLAPLVQSPHLAYLHARADVRSAQAAELDTGLASERRRALVETYTRRALAELVRAQGQGYFKTPATYQKLKTEADLKPLHTHAEFQQLLSAGAGTELPNKP